MEHGTLCGASNLTPTYPHLTPSPNPCLQVGGVAPPPPFPPRGILPPPAAKPHASDAAPPLHEREHPSCPVSPGLEAQPAQDGKVVLYPCYATREGHAGVGRVLLAGVGKEADSEGGGRGVKAEQARVPLVSALGFVP